MSNRFQDICDLLSVPRKKSVRLNFEEISYASYIEYSVDGEALNVNDWTSFDFPKEYEGLYTHVRIRLTWGNGIIGNWRKEIDNVATYTVNMDYEDATLLRSEDNDTKQIYIAINENKDKLYFYQKAPSSYYLLKHAIAQAVVPALTLKNENIVKESLKIEDSLCASSYELRFGRCEARCLKITIAYDGVQQFRGRWLEAYIDLNIPDYLIDSSGNRLVNEDGDYLMRYQNEGFTRLSLGKFKVFSDKPKNDRSTRELVCYDAIYDINNMNVRPWFDGLTFPMTVKNFRDSFFNYVGVDQETTTLINDSYEVKGQYGDNSILTGKTIIESICEINGVFGHINYQGMPTLPPKFQYVSIPTGDSIEYPYYVDESGSYEDYVTDLITGVIMIDEEGQADTTTMSGYEDNLYVIRDNPIVYGSKTLTGTKTALENLYNKIKDISYRPFTLKTFGIPNLPVGTAVTINTKNKTINSLIMSKKLNGIQSMKDNIEAYGDKRLENNQNFN